jgi:hypothetical protein
LPGSFVGGGESVVPTGSFTTEYWHLKRRATGAQVLNKVKMTKGT